MSNMDDFFLTVMGSLIILMQAGFGFLEAGSVRSKNTTNILIKNFADLCFGGLSFWLVGYAIAFGEGNGFVGYTNFAAVNLPKHQYTFLFFQCTFAATCATIVSGAIAERCNFNGYIIFSILVTGITYPVGVHWCWGPGGWLGDLGYSDFAGSGVVHLSGGIIALTGAYILGPRIDRFQDANSTYISGHSIPLVALGGFILVFGFMAFNGGSQSSISNVNDGQAIGLAIMSTLTSCASGGIVVLFIWKMTGGVWSLARIVNGCITGMVSVSGGCDGFYPWAGAVSGSIAGVMYLLTSHLMVKLKIDDPLDAVAVHAGGGMTGILLAPLLRNNGVFYTASLESLSTLLWNAVGAGCLILWHLVTGAALFIGLHKAKLFRVDPQSEVKGLDVIKHREPAYAFGKDSWNRLMSAVKGLRAMTAGKGRNGVSMDPIRNKAFERDASPPPSGLPHMYRIEKE